ncbi:hypothetical protein ANCCEY_12700 [Ancylostoma ceylanicum]|uniref:Uncharacterized protein n=1 Tax=Ancylostoma ceylanicum TaxID=53326 RepID=A0A0D6L938_9BILA|nr:hypothetical protein ANCCEY_12700 [Ancylostoma ceylanicum]
MVPEMVLEKHPKTQGPTCDGIQCGEVESCSAGYVLVSANNRDLGYVMVEECTDFN